MPQLKGLSRRWMVFQLDPVTRVTKTRDAHTGSKSSSLKEWGL